MLRKLAIGLSALVFFAANSSAQFYPQNARIDALGGSFIVNDRSDLLRYTAYMGKYVNSAEVSFKSAPIFGVKGFGDAFSLGVLANRGLMLNTAGANFYNFAATSLNAALGTEANVSTNINDLSNTPQNVPHVLLGFNLGEMGLGLDLFMEYTRTSGKLLNNPPDPADEEETKVSATVYNPGIIASLNFGSEAMPISVKAGVGFPNIHGVIDQPAPAEKIEVNSNKRLYLDLGAELGFTLFNLQWTAGTEWLYDRYQFKRDTILTETYGNTRLAFYAGFETTIAENVLLTLLYDFQIRSNGHAPETVSYENHAFRNNGLTHIISAGLEKPWENAWVFDKFALRAGLDYRITTAVSREHGSSGSDEFKKRVKDDPVFNNFDPRLGLGFTKGFFGLDLVVHPAEWDKLVNGPGVAQVTASMAF